ncbi:hypothetical protein STENM327S_08699 [Streptomyces tendae]
MARHASPRTPHTQRALVALATAGAALAAGAATASADGGETIAGLAHTRPTSLGNIDPQAGLAAVTGTVGYVTGPAAASPVTLKPNSAAGYRPSTSRSEHVRGTRVDRTVARRA